MGKYKNLLLNTGLFAFSQFGTKLIAFFLVPIYTYYMSSEQFGITDMSTTVISFLVPLATLSISDAVLRFVIDDNDCKDRYISIGVSFLIISTVVVCILTPLLNISWFGGLGEYKFLFILCYIANVCSSFFGLVSRSLNQVKLIPISSIVTSLVTSGLAIFLIAYLGYRTEGYFWSLIVGNISGALVYFLFGRHYRYINFSFHKDDISFLKRMLQYSVPMVPNTLFWWVGVSINRFFITGLIGIGASGLFAAAQKIPSLLNTVAGIFQQAWQLSAFQEFKKNDISRFFSTIFCLYHSAIAITGSVIIILSQWLASILLQKEFYSVWPLISILILAFYFNILNSFYGTIYTTTMNTKHLMTTTVAGAFSSIVLTWIMIKIAGIYGAAFAMVFSNMLVLILRILNSRQILKIDANWAAIIFTVVLLFLQCLISVFQFRNYVFFSSVIAMIIFITQIFSCSGLLISFIDHHKRGKHRRRSV